MTTKCGWCIGPPGAIRPHCNGSRCTSCEECQPEGEEMKNAELQEQLGDFGDHLDVVVVVTDEHGEETTYDSVEVDTDNTSGEVRVVLAVED